MALRFRKQFLVCPMKHAAVLMTLVGDHSVIPLDDDVRAKSKEFYFHKNTQL